MKEKHPKLYRVTLDGMTSSNSGIVYGISYVIAESMDDAYNKVKVFLDTRDIGFPKHRALSMIEVIADSYPLTNNGYLLFL